jgi:hypothetical protein
MALANDDDVIKTFPSARAGRECHGPEASARADRGDQPYDRH